MQPIGDPNIVHIIESIIRNTKFKHIEALTNISFQMTWKVKSDFSRRPKNLPILIQSCRTAPASIKVEVAKLEILDFEMAAESSEKKTITSRAPPFALQPSPLLMPS